jgi:hypothetical protein
VLGPGRKARLEDHLRSCAACRAYKDGLVCLQAGALPPAEPSADYWDSFETRQAARLRGVEIGRNAVAAPFVSRRNQAWAAAAVVVLAAAGIWLALLRKGPAPMEAWVSPEDALTPLLQEAEADPELGNLVNREVLASIAELAPPLDADVAALSAADPLFWEGLSEDELLAIASELEKETGHGGPQ